MIAVYAPKARFIAKIAAWGFPCLLSRFISVLL